MSTQSVAAWIQALPPTELLDVYVAACNRESELQDAELSPEAIRAGVVAAFREALLSLAPRAQTDELQEAAHHILRLLDTDRWKNARSGSEKSGAYLSARNEAYRWIWRQSNAAGASAERAAPPEQALYNRIALAACDLVNNDGAGSEYSAVRSYEARERLRTLLREAGFEVTAGAPPKEST